MLKKIIKKLFNEIDYNKIENMLKVNKIQQTDLFSN